MTDNAVLRLRQFRLDRATRPFWRAVAGWRVVRVACCRIKLPVRHHSSAAGRQPFLPDHVRRRAAQAQQHRPPDRRYPAGHPGVPLVAHRDRSALLAAINDPARQPYVVFPASYADAERPVFSQLPAGGKPPLFIMLDGTWAEARKMFRKSPYLNQFPVFSLNVDAASDYQLREASRAEQHCTAEVAAALLQQAGDLPAADGLNQHFRYFRQQYLAGKPTRPEAPVTAM